MALDTYENITFPITCAKLTAFKSHFSHHIMTIKMKHKRLSTKKVPMLKLEDLVPDPELEMYLFPH